MQRFTMNVSNGSVVPIESKTGEWLRVGEVDYEMSTLRYEKEEALEQIAALKRIIDTQVSAQAACPVCSGDGKTTSELPCACGGSGKITDAYDYLRKRNLDLDEQIATLKDQLRIVNVQRLDGLQEIATLTADVQKWIRIAGENQKSANLCAEENERYRDLTVGAVEAITAVKIFCNAQGLKTAIMDAWLFSAQAALKGKEV